MKAPIEDLMKMSKGKRRFASLYICAGEYDENRCNTQFVAVQYLSVRTRDLIIADEIFVRNVYDEKPTRPGGGTSAQSLDGCSIRCLKCHQIIGQRHGSKYHLKLFKLKRFLGRDFSDPISDLFS